MTSIRSPRSGTPTTLGYGLVTSQACRLFIRVNAVVSLCRVQDSDLPVGIEQIDVRLIDAFDPEANPNLDFVLTDTVRLIEQLRTEGRTVLLHCVATQSRTPTIAALYGARKQGIGSAAALQSEVAFWRVPIRIGTSVEPCARWHLTVSDS